MCRELYSEVHIVRNRQLVNPLHMPRNFLAQFAAKSGEPPTASSRGGSILPVPMQLRARLREARIAKPQRAQHNRSRFRLRLFVYFPKNRVSFEVSATTTVPPCAAPTGNPLPILTRTFSAPAALPMPTQNKSSCFAHSKSSSDHVRPQTFVRSFHNRPRLSTAATTSAPSQLGTQRLPA